jgi:hypothetical protein
MKLHVTQDFAVPREQVFDRVADFARFEERAQARGAEVLPLTEEHRLGWRILFDWRGLRHEVDMVIESIERPEGYTAWIGTRGISGTGAISTAPRNGGSRLTIDLDLNATSFAGRLVMQTLGFARPALEARLKRRLESLAQELETARR